MWVSTRRERRWWKETKTIREPPARQANTTVARATKQNIVLRSHLCHTILSQTMPKASKYYTYCPHVSYNVLTRFTFHDQIFISFVINHPDSSLSLHVHFLSLPPHCLNRAAQSLTGLTTNPISSCFLIVSAVYRTLGQSKREKTIGNHTFTC